MTKEAAAGMTVKEIARRYRVSPDKVRTWIARCELGAINTSSALCGKPRYVILPEHLTAFEQRRAGGPLPKPTRRRMRQVLVDYYPEDSRGIVIDYARLRPLAGAKRVE